MVGIGEATMFSYAVLLLLLRENTQSLQDISLEYTADTLREETRILVEDV